MSENEFYLELHKLGIELTNKQKEQLETYYKLLVSYNEKVNLTAITEKDMVYLKHFYDSLTLIKAVSLKGNLKLCDIGTGAGFPGLVLKIVFPNLDICLVDSLEKRVKFLNYVIESLSLEHIKVINKRCEKLIFEEEFDIVVSRAVAKINVLLEQEARLAKINGLVIFMKANLNDELINSKKALKVLNYQLKEVVNFKLPIENSERNIVVLQKLDKTNKKYPREFSKIKKMPL